MGTWGYGSFDNDDAADWVYEFESSGRAAVTSALRRVAELANGKYLEAPEATTALAAAEIVAAAHDGDLSKLSEEARKAFVAHRQSLTGSVDVATARKAVERVARESELKELWEESDESQNWLNEVNGLLARLR